MRYFAKSEAFAKEPGKRAEYGELIHKGGMSMPIPLPEGTHIYIVKKEAAAGIFHAIPSDGYRSLHGQLCHFRRPKSDYTLV